MEKITILVVEDSVSNLQLVDALLRRQGFAILGANNAQEALVILKTARPHMILLDLQLPDMDGLQLAKLLKKNPSLRDIPIIALTGFSQESEKQAALNAGLNGYITKPFDSKELLSTITKLVSS